MSVFNIWFRNNNPDKGTETRAGAFYVEDNLFRNNNPDKGTETGLYFYFSNLMLSFRNNNPDKGTETI